MKNLKDWNQIISCTELNNVLDSLERLYKIKEITPESKKVFKAFQDCDYRDLKVVMLGYDPYPQKGVATGLLFGNDCKDDSKLSPSLEIIKEAAINYETHHNTIRFDNSLEMWAKQGVLLLNSALTVEVGNTGSHILLWRPFISRVLKNISENNNAIIFVLFGEQAKTFKPYINQEAHYIITSHHPSYYARTHTKMPSSLFTEINKILTNINGIQIKWYNED